MLLNSTIYLTGLTIIRLIIYSLIMFREFYKYTSAGDSERNAFLKICRHTLEEYKRRLIEQNKRAYKLTQKHLFSDERATPDSRFEYNLHK